MPAEDSPRRLEVPEALLPAVYAAAETLEGVPADLLNDKSVATHAQRMTVAADMFRAAIEARAIVSRADYDDVDTQLRQANGRFERITAQMQDVGAARERVEALCHRMADALHSGVGVSEVLAEYQAMVWT